MEPAADTAPTPAELDKVRIHLEYLAAQLPFARIAGDDGQEFAFGVSPEVEVTFGKAPARAFNGARELIDYTLAFVNREEVPLPESDPRAMVNIDQLFMGGARAEQLRDWLKRFLSQLRADRAKARRWVTRQLPDLWVLPYVESTAGAGIRLRFRVLLLTPEALLRFVVLLLAADSGDFEIRQCQLSACGRFFLKSRPAKGLGAPRLAYCRAEHMKEAHKADAIKRAERSRNRKRAAKASARRHR